MLYRIDNAVPVILLYGKVPAWRALAEGMTGQDVAQLNHDLVALGYANSGDIAALGWDYFGWDTRYGLEQLQLAVGDLAEPRPGRWRWGRRCSSRRALRVATLIARPGRPGGGGGFSPRPSPGGW